MYATVGWGYVLEATGCPFWPHQYAQPCPYLLEDSWIYKTLAQDPHFLQPPRPPWVAVVGEAGIVEGRGSGKFPFGARQKHLYASALCKL